MQKCIFGPPYVRIGRSVSFYLKVLTQRNYSRISSRECQFYSQNSELAFQSHPLGVGLLGNILCDSSLAGWKACSRLPINYNCIFVAISYGWGTNTSKSASLYGWVTLGLNIRLKGYIYRQHLYTHQPANFEVATFSRCRCIKGEPPILGSSSSPAHAHFFCGCDYLMSLGQPKPHTKSEVASFSGCGNIEGNPKFLGSSPSPWLRLLFLWVWFYDGPWQTEAAYQIRSR